MLAAIRMLEAEIKRDNIIIEGEMSIERLEKVRTAIASDLEFKNMIIKELENERDSSLRAALELIKRTVAMEESIVLSKSSSSKKRKQVQRRLNGNLPLKEEALEKLKAESGD